MTPQELQSLRNAAASAKAKGWVSQAQGICANGYRQHAYKGGVACARCGARRKTHADFVREWRQRKTSAEPVTVRSLKRTITRLEREIEQLKRLSATINQ